MFRNGSRLTYDGRGNFLSLQHGTEITEAPSITFLGPSSLIGHGEHVDSDDLLYVSGKYNIDIESEVSGPALEWDTTGLDLFLKPDLPVDFEVISPDNCNIMFVDANGDLFPPNPCIKYWRSFEVTTGDVDLVNNHANHAPFGECPAAALYLVDNLLIGNPGILDLQGHAIYYGGGLTLIGSIIDSVTGTPRVRGLRKTKYGDFDADCDVDSVDRVRLVAAWSGSGVVTDYPLADGDGDCDVDVVDMALLTANFGTAVCWSSI